MDRKSLLKKICKDDKGEIYNHAMTLSKKLKNKLNDGVYDGDIIREKDIGEGKGTLLIKEGKEKEKLHEYKIGDFFIYTKNEINEDELKLMRESPELVKKLLGIGNLKNFSEIKNISLEEARKRVDEV